MGILVYHNPACGTSRKVLGLLEERGLHPEVVEYLKAPPSREKMKQILHDMGMTPRQILRRKGMPYDALGLDNPSLSDDDLLDALGQHPILMERPVVVTAKGTAVCRPAEKLEDLL